MLYSTYNGQASCIQQRKPGYLLYYCRPISYIEGQEKYFISHFYLSLNFFIFQITYYFFAAFLDRRIIIFVFFFFLHFLNISVLLLLFYSFCLLAFRRARAGMCRSNTVQYTRLADMYGWWWIDSISWYFLWKKKRKEDEVTIDITNMKYYYF